MFKCKHHKIIGNTHTKRKKKHYMGQKHKTALWELGDGNGAREYFASRPHPPQLLWHWCSTLQCVTEERPHHCPHTHTTQNLITDRQHGHNTPHTHESEKTGKHEGERGRDGKEKVSVCVCVCVCVCVEEEKEKAEVGKTKILGGKDNTQMKSINLLGYTCNLKIFAFSTNTHHLPDHTYRTKNCIVSKMKPVTTDESKTALCFVLRSSIYITKRNSF